jgi:hypothetical protein
MEKSSKFGRTISNANWTKKRKLEQIKFRECLLTFSSNPGNAY